MQEEVENKTVNLAVKTTKVSLKLLIRALIAYKRKLENKQRLKQHKQAVAEKKASRERERYISQNGLCGICKTAYSDCERMQSNFTYSPKGVHFENGKITKCPKFKG